MNSELNESLFELYEQDGLELFLEGTRGVKRAFVSDTEEGELSSDLGKLTCNQGITLKDKSCDFYE